MNEYDCVRWAFDIASYQSQATELNRNLVAIISSSEQINISSYCDEDPPLYIKPMKNRIAHEILDAKVRMFSFNCINKTKNKKNIKAPHSIFTIRINIPKPERRSRSSKKWKPSTRGCWMYTCHRGRRLIDKGDPRNDYQSARLRGGCQSAVHSAWVNGGWEEESSADHLRVIQPVSEKYGGRDRVGQVASRICL